MKKLVAGQHVAEEDLMLLAQLPGFYSKLCSILLPMKNDPIVALLTLHKSQQQEASLEELFERVKMESTAQVCSLWGGIKS